MQPQAQPNTQPQAPHRYPVGVQVFGDIRTQGYLYADKTGYIWEMINAGGKYRFLSRPRRFGKTLLVSTIEAYFQGRKDLFTGWRSNRSTRARSGRPTPSSAWT